MATARVPVLRHLLTSQPRALRVSNQRRWAQVHDVRFLATTQAPRNILEKYRDKLDRKAREEGHEDIDSLKAAYNEKIQKLRKEAEVGAEMHFLQWTWDRSTDSATVLFTSLAEYKARGICGAAYDGDAL
ncbi:hypothetical protein N0V88_004055 [Collariella sp. IMI 366227]|nr:hypothetical protein N0V88_004055 [Collariella sp. IMI 366227]